MTITIGAGRIRADKKLALSIVTQLLDGAVPRREDLESLYLYFAPPLPKKPREPWQWVALACAPKDLRDYLKYLHSDGKTLTGCSGARMHWTPTDLPPGWYDPRTCARVPDMDGVKAPPWGRVMGAEDPASMRAPLSLDSRPCEVQGGMTAARVDEALYPLAQLQDAAAGGNAIITRRGWLQDPAADPTRFAPVSLRIVCDMGQAVVMPMRNPPTVPAARPGVDLL